METLNQDVARFAATCRDQQEKWRRDLNAITRNGGRVVLWGGGSKAVAFLTTIDIQGAVDYVVDINPMKHGTYLPGTGQEVVAADFLRDYRPDFVVVMNPVYLAEIGQDLEELGLAPELMAL